MAKFLKIILFLLFVVALGGATSGAFTHQTVGVNNLVCQYDGNMQLQDMQQEGTCVDAPQLPYLPDAELAGGSGHTHLLMSSRVQRSYTTEYTFSLRSLVDKLAHHEAMLSLHREKLYDTTTYYRCHPVCEYYIFALRRIII